VEVYILMLVHFSVLSIKNRVHFTGKVIISVEDELLCEINISYTQYVVKKALGKYA
jgi:hypothetical protein